MRAGFRGPTQRHGEYAMIRDPTRVRARSLSSIIAFSNAGGVGIGLLVDDKQGRGSA